MMECDGGSGKNGIGLRAALICNVEMVGADREGWGERAR